MGLNAKRYKLDFDCAEVTFTRFAPSGKGAHFPRIFILQIQTDICFFSFFIFTLGLRLESIYVYTYLYIHMEIRLPHQYLVYDIRLLDPRAAWP